MKIKETNTFQSSQIPAKLYLDDIEIIINKLESYGLLVEISDSEKIYENIEECIDHKGISPKLISIKGDPKETSLNFIYIRVSSVSSSVYVRGQSDLIRLGYEIEKILIGRKRKLIYFFFNTRIAISNLVVTPIMASLVIGYNILNNKDYNLTTWIFMIVFWALILIVSEFNPDSNTKIQLERKGKTNFYELNKDKILLIIITALISVSLTTLVSYFIKK